MSTTYIQLDLPLVQIHCLDSAIIAAGGTWNRSEILIELEQARQNLAKAENTVQLIQANQELARMLKDLANSETPQQININIGGLSLTLSKQHGRYVTRVSTRDTQRVQAVQNSMNKIQSNYQAGVNKLRGEIEQTLKRLEEQKDILSSEQLQMERLRIQNEKLAIDSANEQRVLEVTKELEEKLTARGFEIRKRLIGKKVIYQAVRR